MGVSSRVEYAESLKGHIGSSVPFPHFVIGYGRSSAAIIRQGARTFTGTYLIRLVQAAIVISNHRYSYSYDFVAFPSKCEMPAARLLGCSVHKAFPGKHIADGV